jgi:hypothetical protein
MTRTPQEIFQHHGGALIAGDIDEIVADYTDDAVFITPAGCCGGKTVYERPSSSCSMISRMRSGKYRRKSSRGTFCSLSGMRCPRPPGRAMDGIDTFVFSEDGIRVQTVRYTLESIV